MSDIRSCERQGFIDRAPSFNTILRYMQDDEMTDILTRLIVMSALPLRAVEEDFAIDSTGFGTSRKVTWFSYKHGREIAKREWVKVHGMTGVETHIVTAVEVTGWAGADSPQLAPLVATTGANFRMREVSADKAYSSKANHELIAAAGATPYIAFKDNTAEPPEGTVWAPVGLVLDGWGGLCRSAQRRRPLRRRSSRRRTRRARRVRRRWWSRRVRASTAARLRGLQPSPGTAR